MTGQEALEMVVKAQSDFFLRHERTPTQLRLPVPVAYGLMRLGSEHMGYEYAKQVWTEGMTAFARLGIHGMEVELVPNGEVECLDERES